MDENPLKDARDSYHRLQTAAEGHDSLERAVAWIRKQLAEAKADVTALDPTGAKNAAAMEHNIAEIIRAATLRGAQKNYREFTEGTYGLSVDLRAYQIGSMVDALKILGLPATALDVTGHSTEDQIKERIADAASRRCLLEARDQYKGYITSQLGGWADLTDHIEGQILKHLQAAGGKPEDLDPDGKTTAQDVDRNFLETRQRLHLIEARDKVKEYEEAKSTTYADHPEKLEERVRGHLQKAGRGLAALDESGKSSVADIEARFKKAADRLRINGARELFKELQEITEEKLAYSSFERKIRQLHEFLEAAGASMAVLDTEGKKTSAMMEHEVSTVQRHLYFLSGRKDLADFEAIPAPKTLREIYDKAESITQKFNNVGAQLAAEVKDDPDFRQKVDVRVAAALERAQKLYYDAGGQVPTMKKLRIVTKNAEA